MTVGVEAEVGVMSVKGIALAIEIDIIAVGVGVGADLQMIAWMKMIVLKRGNLASSNKRSLLVWTLNPDPAWTLLPR